MSDWYLTREGQGEGPYTWEQLLELAREGGIKKDDLLWTVELKQWTPAEQVEAIASFIKPGQGEVKDKEVKDEEVKGEEVKDEMEENILSTGSSPKKPYRKLIFMLGGALLGVLLIAILISAISKTEDIELILDETIETSNEKQSIITEDNVGLIVPPNFVDEPVRFTVHKYSEGNLEERAEELFEPAAIYSFEIEGMDEFEETVYLQFPLPEGATLEDQFQVGRWSEGVEKDEDVEGWKLLSYYIDKENDLLFVPTDHFSDYATAAHKKCEPGRLQEITGTRCVKSTHFQVWYKDSYHPAAFGSGDNIEEIDIDDYALKVAEYLEDYLASYQEIGLNVPVEKEVSAGWFTREREKVPVLNQVWLHPGGTDYNRYSPIRERITIATVGNHHRGQLKATAGHELFHRVQHRVIQAAHGKDWGYLTPYQMMRALSVVEITAEYAGHRLLLDGQGGFSDQCLVSTEYRLKPNLDLMSRREADGHYYAMARFLDFMIRSNENPRRDEVFMDIWHAVVDSSGNRIDDFLEAVMQGTDYNTIEDAMLDFLREAVTDEEYHILGELRKDLTKNITLDYSSDDDDDDDILYSGEIKVEDDRAFSMATIYSVTNLPEDHSGKILPVIIEYDDASSGIYVDQFNAPPQDIFFNPVEGGLETDYRFWSRSYGTPVTTLILSDRQDEDDPHKIHLQEGVQFIAYGNNSGDSVRITVRDAGRLNMSIEPAEVEADFVDARGIKTVDFTVTIENIPELLEFFDLHWDFGDGRSNSSGKRAVEVDGKTEMEFTKSHTYHQDEELERQVYTVQIYLTATSFTSGAEIEFDMDREMAWADAVVAFGEEEVLDDAEVHIKPSTQRDYRYELVDGANRVTHDFEAVALPEATYSFEWDFDDGNTFSETKLPGESSTVSHTYSNLEDGEVFNPTVKLYCQEGELLDQTSIRISIIEELAGPSETEETEERYSVPDDRDYFDEGYVLTDNLTGLMWAMSDDTHRYGRDLESAKNYVENLTIGGYTDWRVPTREELESLGREHGFQGGEWTLSVMDPPFNLISRHNYWTSTYKEDSTWQVWTIEMVNGMGKYRSDAYNRFVFPVRGP